MLEGSADGWETDVVTEEGCLLVVVVCGRSDGIGNASISKVVTGGNDQPSSILAGKAVPPDVQLSSSRKSKSCPSLESVCVRDCPGPNVVRGMSKLSLESL